MDHRKMPIYEALDKFSKKNITAFDVPGHKRSDNAVMLREAYGERALSLDINSMPELDNLNYPTGVIQHAQDMMADAFGADHAFFVVNGTTLAVHAMILSAVNPGEKIILPRNVHKSVINALILCDSRPVYMQSEVSQEFGFATGVTIENVRKSIDENPDAKAILVVNPTYYGVCSQLKDIIEYAHSKGLVVLVDEAHGAHFGFHPELPESAMHLGADMAALSIHKTGGSLTQTSAVLLNDGTISRDHVQAILNILHTTSASYLLMSSLDIARSNIALNGREIFTRILELVREARKKIDLIPGLKAFGPEQIGFPGVFNFDETKLVVNVAQTGMTGFEMYDLLLKEYDIQIELADPFNILAIVSLGDSEESLNKLVSALADAVRRNPKQHQIKVEKIPSNNPVVKINPREAFYSKKGFKPLDECVGFICAESVMVYPPGIPFLAPGEYITQDIIDYIKFLKTQHTKLTDMNDKTLENLLVVKKNGFAKE